MTQPAESIGKGESQSPAFELTGKPSSLKLLLRYPVLLLAFGPPVLENKYRPVNPTMTRFDYWSVFQVALVVVVAARAAYRLTFAHSIVIPRPARTIVGLAFFLSALFAISAMYSPKAFITVAFAILYCLNLICILEFLVDVFRNPPNWMRVVIELRFICLLLLGLLILVFLFKPQLAIITTSYGIRLLGGSFCQVHIVCPVIAIVSAYSFLHSLESKLLSASFFLASTAALVASQWRGAIFSLLFVLIFLFIDWARMKKHFQIKMTAFAGIAVLLIGFTWGILGSHRVWVAFSHNQGRESLLNGSDRVDQWVALIRFSIGHPLGLGYIANIDRYAKGYPWGRYGVQGIDNGYLEVLGVAGWLALAVYATIIIKTGALGWRLARNRSLPSAPHNGVTSDSARCAFYLFLYCILEQMENSEFSIPLKQSFYIQYILIAIILGQSATLLSASRSVDAPMTN